MSLRNFRRALFVLTLLILASSSIEAATVRLAWDRSSDGVTVGYVIRYGTSPGNYTQSVDVGNVSTFAINTLTSGVRYYFSVQGYTANRRLSPRSNEVSGVAGSGGSGGTTPRPPSGLAATVRSSDRSVSLTWRAPSGTITGYRVEAGRSRGQRDVISRSIGRTTSYRITGLAAGTYYVRVRALNGSRVSGASNEVWVRIPSGRSGSGTAPKPPTNFAASVRSSGAVRLTWRAPSSPVTSYRVEVGRTQGTANVLARNVGKTTGYTLTGLKRGTYYFRVRSVKSGRMSAPSQSLRRTVTRSTTANLTETATDSLAESSAENLAENSEENLTEGSEESVTEGALENVTEGSVESPTLVSPTDVKATLRDNKVIDLSWQPQDPAATIYRVEVGTEPSKTDVSSFTTGVTSSLSIGELPARTYYVRVLAGNDEGFSEPSEEVVVGGVAGNDAPRSLVAQVGANGGVRLAWEAPQNPTGVVGYLVEAGRAPGRADAATFETTDRTLTSGPIEQGTYFVRVRSMTAAGAGSASNEIVVHVGATPQCTAPPTVPQLAAQALGTMVNLSWAPGSGDQPTSYLLDVGTAPGRRDITSIPLGTDVTTLSTEVQNGSYALQLIAVNACGASAPSAGTVVTVGGPEVATPGAPVNLTQLVSERTATLTWSPATAGGEVTSYAIEVVSPTGQVLLTIDTGNTSTTFTHGEVPPGEYTVRVRGVNARGAGAPSNSVTVRVE
jgi:hypothetical protein